MSGLFRKEVKSATIIEPVKPAEPQSFLGKGTKATSGSEDQSVIRTLEGLSKHAAGREARRDVARRPHR